MTLGVRHLLFEEVVKLGADAPSHGVLVLVVHSLVQAGQLLILNHLLHTLVYFIFSLFLMYVKTHFSLKSRILEVIL